MHDDFPSRLRICIGDEPVAAFARRCGFSEGLIRAYLKGEKHPGMDNLVRMSDAAGVTVDWLATGRGPHRRADLLQSQRNQSDSMSLEALAGPRARRWAKIIELIEAAPTPAEAEAVIDELFARAKERIELAELRQAVRELTAERKKTA